MSARRHPGMSKWVFYHVHGLDGTDRTRSTGLPAAGRRRRLERAMRAEPAG